MHWKSLLSLSESDPSIIFSSSVFELSLHVLNPTLYQKELFNSEPTSCERQLLLGSFFLSVFKTVFIGEIKIRFGGQNFEPLFGILLDGRVARRGLKHTKLVDDSLVWPINCVVDEGIYTYGFNFVVNPLLPESMLTMNRLTKYWIGVELTHSQNTTNKLAKSFHHEFPVTIVRSLPNSLEYYLESLISTGNWRDKFVYEFQFLTKFAFQGHPYTVALKIYSLGDCDCNFRVLNLSAQLCQTTVYHIKSEPRNKKFSETHQVLLLKKFITFDDMENAVTPDGCMRFELDVPMPTISELRTNMLNMNSKNYIYPSTCREIKADMEVTHSLTATLEVVEIHDVDATSLALLRKVPSAVASSIGTSKSDSSSGVAVPPYTRYHEPPDPNNTSSYGQSEEVSTSTPLCLFSCESIYGSDLPPAYSTKLDGPSIGEHLESILSRYQRKFKQGTLLKLPPHYTVTG